MRIKSFVTLAASFLYLNAAQAETFLGDCKRAATGNTDCEYLFAKAPTKIKLAVSSTFTTSNCTTMGAMANVSNATLCKSSIYDYNGWKFRGECSGLTGKLQISYSAGSNKAATVTMDGKEIIRIDNAGCFTVLLEAYK